MAMTQGSVINSRNAEKPLYFSTQQNFTSTERGEDEKNT